MDRNQAKEFYPILQAYAEGKVIECRTKPSAMKGTDVPNDWTEVKEDGVDTELPDIDSLIKKLTSDEYIEKKIKDVLGDDMADGKNKD